MAPMTSPRSRTKNLFHDSGRLVVVSNRVPVPSGAGAPSAGGLAVALDAALKDWGGLWFGWSGETSEDNGAKPLDIREFGPVGYAVTDITQRDLDEYYAGFANRALWPVCHYRLDLTGFARKNTAGYFRVNDFFARRLAPLLHADDLIWVHDYHFIPMAANLRQMASPTASASSCTSPGRPLTWRASCRPTRRSSAAWRPTMSSASRRRRTRRTSRRA